MIDLRDDLIAALRSPEVAAALKEVVLPVLGLEVRAALAEQVTDSFLSFKQAAEFCGLSYGAFRQRTCKDPELAALVVGTGGTKRLRRSDLADWLKNRSPGRRTRRE